jgi:hypothetical protein
MQISRIAVSTGAILLLAASAGIANASTITASLFSPDAGLGPVIIDLTGIKPVSQTSFSGPGYSVSFAVALGPSGQGVVQGAFGGRYAIPVAGIIGVAPNQQAEYLTGGYGSLLTPTAADSGNYFSTGTGSITINFNQPETWFGLLWGSIDTGNLLTFKNGNNTVFTVTGTAVQNAAAGFLSNGFQGPGGSAYVLVNTDTPFTSVIASSSVVSFEFGGVVGSPVPEPSSFLCLFGIGVGIVALRRRIHFR